MSTTKKPRLSSAISSNTTSVERKDSSAAVSRGRPQGYGAYSESLKEGAAAELGFARYASSQGWTVVPATVEHNKKWHVDFVLTRGKSTVTVDVKAAKRVNREDASSAGDVVWLELHGADRFNEGWLLGGHADYIAFEQVPGEGEASGGQSGWLLVRRLDLVRTLLKEVNPCDKTLYVTVPRVNRIYCRRGYERLLLWPLSRVSALRHKLE